MGDIHIVEFALEMGLGILPHLTGFEVSLGFRWSVETFSTEHFLAAALATSVRPKALVKGRSEG